MTERAEVPQNHLEELKELIFGASDRIDAELSRSGNPWYACVGSVIFQLETRLVIDPDMLSTDKYAQARKRVEDLKEELQLLKTGEVSDIVKRDFLAKLNILSEPSDEQNKSL